VSMLLVRVSLGEDSHGADDTGSVTVRVGLDCLDNSAVLTSNLLVDWLADLSRGGGAFFHLCGHRDLDRDGPALGDGLSNAVGLGDSSGDSVAGGDGLGVAEGVSDLPGGGLAGSPWHSNTLGHRHTLGNSNAVRNGDAFWHSNTSGHCNAMRNSDAFGNSDTFGDGNGTGPLDRDLSALSVNLLLALWSNSNRGSNSYRGSNSHRSNRGSSKSNRCWAGSKTTYWESIESKELSISIGISFSFSIGLTLANCMGKELWSSRENTSWKNTGRKSSSVKSKSRRKKTGSSHTSSRKSIDNSRSCNSMTNNLGMGLDLHLGLSAHLMNDVIAFLNKGGFRDGLCLGGALLLSGALLGICALLLCGAGLLGGALLCVLALLLCGALGHVSALLLGDGGALLVGHLPHNVPALCLSVCGALLLINLAGGGGALLD